MAAVDPWVEYTLGSLSLEARIGQMMMVGFDGPTAPPHVLEWLAEGRVGSVVLFARNVASSAQVADLTASLRDAAPLPLLVCADQEGGIVARLRHPFTESPGNMALAASGAPELAERVAQVLAREMRAVGINWNLAPCVDVLNNPRNPAIGVRSLGTDPDRAAAFGVALVRGFQRGRVAACAKHFPGHGDTATDLHLDLPTIQADRARLRAVDLKPFAAAITAGAATVMISHLLVPALDPEYPATLSPAIQTGLLREEMGFDGVIVTDCMEMKAIADRYGAGESTVLAARAGTDVIVHSHTRARQEAAFAATLEAARAGRLPEAQIEASVRRVLTLKAHYARDAEAVPIEEVGSAAHQSMALEAARQGLTLIRGALPALRSDQRIALVEFTFAPGSQAEERQAGTPLAGALAERFTYLEYIALPNSAPPAAQVARVRQLANSADVLILATRSAHLNPEQRALAAEVLANARGCVLLCLRSPWDAAAFPEVETVLATLGDARPSLIAAAETLAGEVVPRGRLPVSLL